MKAPLDRKWAVERARRMALTPQMWASNTESYLVQLCLLLEIAGVDDVRRIWNLIRSGSTVLVGDVTDQFATSAHQLFDELIAEVS